MKIKYVLMNPTGNRTVLVTSPVGKKDYVEIASELLKEEPTAEQVGFLDVKENIKLNMAGGEFCGNATMSAAVYAVMKGVSESLVKLRVSGSKKLLTVEVSSAEDDGRGRNGKRKAAMGMKERVFTGCVKMPSPLEIKKVTVTLSGEKMQLPAVIFDGIIHIILCNIGIAKKLAEQCVKDWSRELGVSCLGLMFYNPEKKRLKPLVYVQSPETLYWENSCGSGTVALAAFLNEAEAEFSEPGGRLSVRRKGSSYYLCGTVTMEKEAVFEYKSPKESAKVRKQELRAESGATRKRSRKKENQKAYIDSILARLDEQYGTDLRCYLNYETPWQLLFATILSAQCTDERVNIVTKDLFVKYKTLEDFANVNLSELERDIHSTGFYHNKAKNIIACAKELLEKYDGEVPSDLESLTSLPGVGRKTANVIRGNIFFIDSIVVDTHVKRISKKLGLTKQDDPEKVEFDLMDKLPRDHWILYNIHIITLGRSICKAPTPKCEECFLKDLCPSFGVK